MKLDFTELEQFRNQAPNFEEQRPGDRFGLFRIVFKGARLQIVACCAREGYQWEHVSVKGHGCCPTWEQMSHVKSLFWEPSECVVQYHPAEKDYVNIQPHVLHLWKPVGVEFPMPPKEMV